MKLLVRKKNKEEEGEDEEDEEEEEEEEEQDMSCCFHCVTGKIKPWRICKCCFAEEKEAEDLVRDVPPSGNGVGHSEEFAPVEHPLEPRDIDKPARCPVPEPCIVHDGTIWKERVAIARRRLDMVKGEDDLAGRRRRSLSSEHLILPSRSAPANVILNLLD